MADEFYEIIEPRLEVQRSSLGSSYERTFSVILVGVVALILLSYWFNKNRNSRTSVLKRAQKLSKSINKTLSSGHQVHPSHKSKLIKLNHLLRSYKNRRGLDTLDSKYLDSIVLSEIESLILKIDAQ